MSCTWWQPWITEPAERNKHALKKAWVTMWNRPAISPRPPQPMAATMKPSCAVVAPMTVMKLSASGDMSGKVRPSKNTPAATIVAAWIMADTGVGPAMASGSQTCSGNCADLPIVPPKTKSPPTVIQPGKTPALASTVRRAISHMWVKRSGWNSGRADWNSGVAAQRLLNSR